MRRPTALSAILPGAAIAGALDITYAILFYGWRGAPATRVLQSVASGLLGASAFEGGAATAALGLVLHFCIALIWAALFYIASRRIALLVRQPVLSGIVYGAIIYAAMNLIVLPLSAIPRKVTFPPLVLVTGLLVHMFFIGLPIALAVRRASRARA